jgi:hypothetical protein
MTRSHKANSNNDVPTAKEEQVVSNSAKLQTVKRHIPHRGRWRIRRGVGSIHFIPEGAFSESRYGAGAGATSGSIA